MQGINSPVSVVVLVSGSGSNLQAILDAIHGGEIKACISAVISNVPDVYALQRAQHANIPTRVLDHTLYDNREAFDAALQQCIEGYQPDLVVLAGFMRLLTPAFVRQYQGRMLNIHPSLLPRFRGLHTHQRALDQGETSHGASVHFVTPDLDSGPVVIQGIVPVLKEDTQDSLAQRVFKVEHVIYPRAIGWFAEGRLAMRDHQVVLDGELLKQPVLYSLPVGEDTALSESEQHEKK